VSRRRQRQRLRPVIDPLPIDAHLDRIVADVRRVRASVVTAAPGAGKTTRVPPALAGDGPVVLLQPRRVAARAIASRIAAERAWTVGREVGWQIRFERKFSDATKLLVVTEGVLTARLQRDPLLSDFRTIVLDEFHERSIHADLAIALARQAWRARDDLRIVVMSATLDAGAVSSFLGGCPVIDVPGRLHPVAVSHAPGVTVADAAAEVLRDTTGDVLCFLPGASEIRRTIGDLQARLSSAGGGSVDVLPLHGSLDSDEQDAALRPGARRRIVVATNIAETSLTVPGISAVVDSGLHKVARYDADRGIDSLETERITRDAADQRAGRAGRLAPGVVRRLWDQRDRLRPHREPEIFRVDLASTVMDVLAWGGDPRTLEWFEAPRADAIDAALALLERLGMVGAVRSGAPKLTAVGERVRQFPLHPRLARMLLAGDGARQLAQACALLSERHLIPPRKATTSSDLLSAIDDWASVPPHVKRVADELARSISNQSAISNLQSAISEPAFLRAILAGYPDRVAQRREPGSPNVRLSSGAGAVIAPESGVRDGEFLVTLDVTDVSRRAALSGPPAGGAKSAALREDEARIRIASRVEREWLAPTAVDVVHRFDKESGAVKAVRMERYDALILSEHPVAIDAEVAANILTGEWRADGDDVQLLRRLRFAGHEIVLDDVVRTAAYGARSLDDIDLARGLPSNLLRELDRDAPEMLTVPSGRQHPLEYNDDGTVSASVKLQELFGLADTPRIGRRREPVLLALLAPNGRPVQLTRDLRSFWDRTYPEVRKELRGRYPKHPWPEDPWTAPPTARTTRRQT
jgi:ATP-dependent helicase HrpB